MTFGPPVIQREVGGSKMKVTLSRSVFAVLAVAMTFGANGQTCNGLYALPAPVIRSPDGVFGNQRKPGDCDIAVGTYREVLTSNYGCQVRCLPNGEPKHDPVPL